MLVKLPRQSSGQEIVNAFKTASTHQEQNDRRWQSFEFIDEFQFEQAPVKQTVRSKGVWAAPFSLRKKYFFFGKKVWVQDYTPTFTLTPVVLSAQYDQVDVKIEYIYDDDQGGFAYTANDPHIPEFEHIRPELEKILHAFSANLQTQSV